MKEVIYIILAAFAIAGVVSTIPTQPKRSDYPEKYYRGDFVMLKIGGIATISDKHLERKGNAYVWFYDVNTERGRTKVNELEIDILLLGSKGRPKLEK